MSKIKKKKTCSLFYVVPKLAYEKKFISDIIKIYWYTRWNHESLASKCIAFFFPFQIVYKDGLLYVYASNEDSRSQWLKALKKGKKMP